ncbi:uncharacterized protein KD926_006276 [Aspergillus affinis]|uniref:uncharacterized protein n=1 Tax=Aspergillus affinis TaxID=1070780 RepID=UPI0022FE3C22|nr:uncharacterized protein KD926_006276 [Aspergillus affinis]KAI9041939.1 hypothetical protein KD926_006276 [Aspergillus affinis]
MRLEHELRGVSDDLICELLIRSGRQHLLAKPKGVDSDLPAEFAEVKMIERRLKSHIADDIVDSAVSECRDQIFDECKTNKAEFRERSKMVTPKYALRPMNTSAGMAEEIAGEAAGGKALNMAGTAVGTVAVAESFDHIPDYLMGFPWEPGPYLK